MNLNELLVLSLVIHFVVSTSTISHHHNVTHSIYFFLVINFFPPFNNQWNILKRIFREWKLLEGKLPLRLMLNESQQVSGAFDASPASQRLQVEVKAIQTPRHSQSNLCKSVI